MPTLIPAAPWRTFLRWMLTTAFIVVATVGAFNFLIDPLGVFGPPGAIHSPRIDGLNATKPYLDHHRELSRYRRALGMCADAGIFGNSRAEIGFDPESPTFSAHGLTAFNHAIPGTGPTTSYQQLLWLKAAGCLPHTIILGVDFFDFLGGSSPRPLPTLQSAPPPARDARFFAESVFSLTGLTDSMETIFLQYARHPETTTRRGFNPLYGYVAEVAASGHYALFRQRGVENLRSWQRKPRQIRPKADAASADEAATKAFLIEATQAGAKIYLIIYPYHAQIRLMLERVELGGLFADWKRELVALTEGSGLKDRVELWDFSGIAQETLEAIPAKGDHRTQLNYYWEAGHFKSALGERIIANLFGAQRNFGIRLYRQNIDRWLQEDRRAVKEVLDQPSPLARDIDEILAKTAK